MCTGAEPAVAEGSAKGATDVVASDAVAGAGGDAIMAAGPEMAGAGEGLGDAIMAAGPEMAGGVGAAGGSSLAGTMGVLKTIAPAVSAAGSLMGALGNPSLPTVPKTPSTQNAVAADVTALRKRNSLLFGPVGTDLTGGSAGGATPGRVTLLGGTSTLGS